MLTTPQVSRFTAMPRLEPCARSRSGVISAVYVDGSDPHPTENAATVASVNATQAAVLAGDVSPMQSVRARPVSEAATPPALASRSGRRPKRSEKSETTSMKHVLTTPMATVAPKMALFDDMPAFLNMSGLYSKMASTPNACWRKLSPTTKTRIRRTIADGRKISSRHTPLSASRGASTTRLISSKRSSASAAVSEVRTSTARASASRPRMASHRGDSGMASTPAARSTGGSTPMAYMTRQLRCTGRPAKA
ncbi:hypothetical protein CFC21_060608 [Triticum aestivum]|uniref:Uncharacterized protein n=2 Tax=Triticum aestivum TaxID=4565 RepID=A0A9R1GTB5_WHEAT|nr:hypothetical protein CFC21_060608 [Triticum aestivum]